MELLEGRRIGPNILVGGGFPAPDAEATQTDIGQNRAMRYLGSKGSVAPQVLDLIGEVVPAGKLCDPFGGIGTIGAEAKRRGYEVWAGDQLEFAHAFQVARIEADRRPAFRRLTHLGSDRWRAIEKHLNGLPPRDGWFVQQYAIKRKFFTFDNATRVEAVRHEISQWISKGDVSSREAKLLRASLIDSADRVANTAGTYYAYLKRWHRKALQSFDFVLIPPTSGLRPCRTLVADASELVARRSWDVLYLDPPFNARRYGRYYHLPETLAGNSDYEVTGRAGMPARATPASDFYTPGKAAHALRELLDDADCRLLVLHYAPDGLIPEQVILDELEQRGTVTRWDLTARGYTTRKSPRSSQHHLYLMHA